MNANCLRRLLLGFAASATLMLALRAGPSNQVLVIFTSAAEPYNEAVEGIRLGLSNAGQSPSVVDLKAAQGSADLEEALRSGAPRLIIAVGTEAWNAANARRADTPMLATMILRSDSARVASAGPTAPRRVAAVSLDVPLSSIAAELASLFPGRTRLGLIRNPSRDAPADSILSAQARQHGFTLQTAECSHPEDLLRVFRSFKGRADFVLVLPDGSLYNQTTVKPLILASLENGLPIIGFSSSFVRAGAAVGIYPDFQDMGQQTAEAALAFLAGRAGLADENPRKLQVAVNQRVMRLLGLEAAGSRHGKLVVYR
ncbi:MAG: hypothetical protein HY238_16445 [Acidobacteria bacterium]|nr:hypothetical protein [Acidobacteriota bacterium]